MRNLHTERQAELEAGVCGGSLHESSCVDGNGSATGRDLSVHTSSVTPGAASAASSFTVSVSKQTAAASRMQTIIPVTLALLLLPFAWLRRNQCGPSRLFLWLLLSIAILGSIVGCGAGGYFSQSEQTYTITVTGTSGSLVRSTTVTLTVE